MDGEWFGSVLVDVGGENVKIWTYLWFFVLNTYGRHYHVVPIKV